MNAEERVAKEVADAKRAAINRPKWGWKYFTWMMVGIAFVVGFGVWFVPDKYSTPEYKADLANRIAKRETAKAYWAEQDRLNAEQKKLEDEQGLIYITPESNPFAPAAGAPAGKAPAGKPGAKPDKKPK